MYGAYHYNGWDVRDVRLGLFFLPLYLFFIPIFLKKRVSQKKI
jgi:hypothetical protein